MIMLAILLMTVLVFTSRYLFLEPKLPLRLGTRTQKVLNYASPAVLTAIWAPIVFHSRWGAQRQCAKPIFTGCRTGCFNRVFY